jgi:hypothetical protein
MANVGLPFRSFSFAFHRLYDLAPIVARAVSATATEVDERLDLKLFELLTDGFPRPESEHVGEIVEGMETRGGHG